MGKDPNPWGHWQHLPWQSMKLNCEGNDHLPPNLGRQDINSTPFPGYTDPRGYGAGGNAPPVFAVSKFLQGSSAFPLHLNPINLPSEEATSQKRFLIFDQSGDQMSLVFSSIGPPVWNLNPSNPKPKQAFDSYGAGANLPINNDPINWSDETNVSDGQGHEEMHEDTEEINALLYSDSEASEEDEDEISTGHSPVGAMGTAEEIVASSSAPAKRRRLDKEDEGYADAALTDTASSARGFHVNCKEMNNIEDESSCVRGGIGGETGDCLPRANKILKRKRIQETVGVLRKIIPGGKGEDATTVLDKAIHYLRSLKLKAKALGSAL